MHAIAVFPHKGMGSMPYPLVFNVLYGDYSNFVGSTDIYINMQPSPTNCIKLFDCNSY